MQEGLCLRVPLVEEPEGVCGVAHQGGHGPPRGPSERLLGGVLLCRRPGVPVHDIRGSQAFSDLHEGCIQDDLLEVQHLLHRRRAMDRHSCPVRRPDAPDLRGERHGDGISVCHRDEEHGDRITWKY